MCVYVCIFSNQCRRPPHTVNSRCVHFITYLEREPRGQRAFLTPRGPSSGGRDPTIDDISPRGRHHRSTANIAMPPLQKLPTNDRRRGRRAPHALRPDQHVGRRQGTTAAATGGCCGCDMHLHLPPPDHVKVPNRLPGAQLGPGSTRGVLQGGEEVAAAVVCFGFCLGRERGEGGR